MLNYINDFVKGTYFIWSENISVNVLNTGDIILLNSLENIILIFVYTLP